MGQPVVHFEIEGLDGEALASFYQEMFGWEITPVPGLPSYSLVEREEGRGADNAGIRGAVSCVPDEPSPTWRGPSRADGYTGHVTVYVEVQDVAAALADAERLGGTIMMGPDEVPGGRIGKFTDPEGHLVGLVAPHQ